MDQLLDGPFWIALGVLTLGAMARGQATYWIARVVTEQALARTHPVEGWRAGVHDWLQGEGPQRGREAIEKWGLVMIPLCYLTIGFQTLVIAAAGMLRIRWLLFTLVQVPGALAWGLIYATIGFAVWGAALAAIAGSPLALAGVVAILLVVGTTMVLAHRRKQDRTRS
ncbi:DedA family protein [Ornithinimicrobium cavernae]|uniref:DedA family protein n=1 Tax=Ornithinimicrobium cavernae TaxID=2666047 RepID=UPI000D68BB4D|nr:VTT domain-containing protein [Ornithinimicrobium cavernae]